MSASDPFPRDRFTALLGRLPAYGRLAWRLAREPLLSRLRRAAIAAAAAYLASPVDLVPGVIPVLGQLDDLAVALAAIRLALAGLSPERRRAHLEAVGLGDADLAADLRALGATTAWVARAGGRTAARAARAGGRVANRGAQGAVAGARRAGSVISGLSSRLPAVRVPRRIRRRDADDAPDAEPV